MSLYDVQLKESGVKNTDLQHQLDKAVKQQQELQTQQQNTTSKLREAQVSAPHSTTAVLQP